LARTGIHNKPMPTIQDVLSELELFAPSRWAFGFDNIGLLFGRTTQTVTKAVVALDASVEAVDFAKSVGAELILTHHPIFFMGTKSVSERNSDGKFVLGCAENGIAHIAAHTNWDSAPGGINDALATCLELNDVRAFGIGAEVSYSKIVVFSPTSYTDIILDAMADAGAGNVGLYRRCAYKSPGIGTFEPLPGSEPFVGRAGKTDELEEDRLEMICPSEKVDRVLAAILEKHPYEQPAYDVLTLRPLVEQCCGRIGNLASPMTLKDFVNFVQLKLGHNALGWGDSSKLVSRVAVVGGAADSEWTSAVAAGADVFVTGEVKHHVSLEATEAGLSIVAGGHFATEQPGMRAMRELMGWRMPSIEWHMFEPVPGSAGSPV
jgi:dinuclear metal center YbgI/SA1388 family protein